jgi:5-methylcytosine-specific restriction endonuclease McrA
VTCWENVVTACCVCNVKKGGKLPHMSGMFPKLKPKKPTVEELHDNGKFFPPNFLHQSWLDYLYWDVKLET